MIKGFIDQKQEADYANASINRWLESLRHAYALGLKELPPPAYVAPEIGDLMPRLAWGSDLEEHFLITTSTKRETPTRTVNLVVDPLFLPFAGSKQEAIIIRSEMHPRIHVHPKGEVAGSIHHQVIVDIITAGT